MKKTILVALRAQEAIILMFGNKIAFGSPAGHSLEMLLAATRHTIEVIERGPLPLRDDNQREFPIT